MLFSLIANLNFPSACLAGNTRAKRPSTQESTSTPAPSPEPKAPPDPSPEPGLPKEAGETRPGAANSTVTETESSAAVTATNAPPVAPDRRSAPAPESSKAPFALGVEQNTLYQGAQGQQLQGNLGANGMGQPLTGNLGANGLGQPMNGTAQNFPLNAAANGAPLSGGLTQLQLKRLSERDVVLVIDRSGSMMTPDCPLPHMGKGGAVLSLLLGSMGSMTRWDWCRDQTLQMAKQTEGIYNQGITVVLFSNGFEVFPHTTLDKIPLIFSNNMPMGNTALDRPIAMIISDYFARRRMTNGHVKPITIAIVTDGCPDNQEAVKQSIVQATNFMANANEITVTFFLIGGRDFRGERFISDISSNLMRDGARFDIVNAVSFGDLQKEGLARAIADTLK